MAYSVDYVNGDIVINGWENGIAPSPYEGITDIKSMNPDSVPGEVSVEFSLVNKTAPLVSASVTSTASSTVTSSSSITLQRGQAIYFTNSSNTGVLPNNTPYWVATDTTGTSFSFYTDYKLSSSFTISTAGVTATMQTYNMGLIKKFDTLNPGSTDFAVDANGLVWSNSSATTSGYWRYTGNTTDSTSHGNGLVCWKTPNPNAPGNWDGWVFVFRDGQIDYCNAVGVSGGVAYNNIGSWNYGWNPATATTGNSGYLQGANEVFPHPAIVAAGNVIVYGDLNFLGKFFQTDPLTTAFSPTSSGSYAYVSYPSLVPGNDNIISLATFSASVMIGGVLNMCYLWDLVDTKSTPILFPESYMQQIVVVNTNAYVFCGNRGNIYITNGSQANLWAKVPDHISGTVEPYILFTDATYQKGRLYFTCYGVYNSGGTIDGYGGVWAINVEQQRMWLAQMISTDTGTYSIYGTALYAYPQTFLSSPPTGLGILVGTSDSRIDGSSDLPYNLSSSSQNICRVITDVIPIGTAIQPITPGQIEYKLVQPLQAGEQIIVYAAPYLPIHPSEYTTWEEIGTTVGTSTNNPISDIFSIPFQEFQWIVLRVDLFSTANPSTTSWLRLRELRLKGATQDITAFRAQE